MKKLCFPVVLVFFFSINTYSQFIHKIKADSVLITNDSCTAELNLENSTKDTIGFLYNKGNGRTEFRKGLIRLSDSLYIIGNDTLDLNKGLGVNWELQSSVGMDLVWENIAYGNGLFVAVASSGTGSRVATTPDGIHWKLRTTPANNAWEGITYGNGLFVAVAKSGTNRVMTSPDGITWTIRTIPFALEWRRITYGNGLFVAVATSGTGNRVMTSPDGITWTSRISAADRVWRDVTYGNGLFVAVSNSMLGDDIMTSPDGITWTLRVAPSNSSWNSITYGNGLFVAVAYSGIDKVMTSSDGITWTPGNTTAANGFENVIYGNGVFAALSISGINKLMTSVNGITWTVRKGVHTNAMSKTAYGNGLFVSVAYNGTGNRFMKSGFIIDPSISNPINQHGDFNFTGNVFSTGGFYSNASAANSNFSVPTSSTAAAITQAEFLFAGATSVSYRVGTRGSTNYVVPVNNSYTNLIMGAITATEAASGTHSLLSGMVLKPLAITNAAATTTDATTLYIEGPPTGITPTNPTTSLWVKAGNSLFSNGNIELGTAGNKLKIATGTNASVGTATLVAGTVTVNTTAVTTNSKIFVTRNTPGGTVGDLSVPSASITNGVSFVINSSSSDTSTVNWWIIN